MRPSAATGGARTRPSGTAIARAVPMATFGHLAAGLAASRLVGVLDPRAPSSAAEAVLIAVAAEVPDLDFLLPVRHRGRTHSVVMGVAAGTVVGLALGPRSPRRAVAIGVTTAVATWSHVLLDLATAESGTASLWPIVKRRLSAPAAPLPATPVGRELFTLDGLRQAAGEVAWAAPLAAIGLWPLVTNRGRRRRVSRP